MSGAATLAERGRTTHRERAPRPDADWPNREASRIVSAGGVSWHVQVMGSGPPALLLHGTGAATHSWRAFAPMLAERFTVVAPDLPGHGFTSRLPSRGATLPGMAQAIAALLRVLDVAPALAVGHSAGAAILARMALDQKIAPRALVSLNGALLPMRGPFGAFFSPLAKMLVMNPFVPRIFAWTADDRAVERLVRETGSTLESEGVALYARLVRNPDHVAGALAMMADWDLFQLERDLPHLATPLTLVVGDRDRTIPPDQARTVAGRVPGAVVETVRGTGHLAHEERPREIADLVMSAFEGAP